MPKPPTIFQQDTTHLKQWWLTISIIAINVMLYLVQILTGVDPANPSAQQAMAWGANYAPISFYDEPIRLFTSLFFHFGFVHLALNMWVLSSFGQIAEQIYGRFYYLALYVFCGISGNLLSNWIDLASNTPHVSAGASGAIMGLGGALLCLSFFKPKPTQPFILNKKTLIYVMAINLGFGLFVSQINNSAHLGGFIMGIWLTLGYYFLEKYKALFTLFTALLLTGFYFYTQYVVIH